MQRRSPGKIIKVTWESPCSSNKIVTVGFVVKQTNDAYTLAQEYNYITRSYVKPYQIVLKKLVTGVRRVE